MALTWKTINDIQEKLLVALSESLNGSTVREKISTALDAWQDVVEAYKNDDYYSQFLTQSLHKTIKSSTVYSDSFDEMIQKDFTYKGNKYTWNDIDCVYYNDNGDEEDFFMEIPEGAITSAKKLIESDYMDYIDYPSRMFKGARFENPNGVICEIVKVEPENNYVLYKFNDKFPEDTTIDGIIALLKHNNYYPIASNTPGKVIREEEDGAGYTVQLVELDDGRYKVCDNNGTEDICNTYDEARKMFYMYLG